ncbi:MAG: hypothetical protein ABFS37_00450 [Acidobacteriota bacterium]
MTQTSLVRTLAISILAIGITGAFGVAATTTHPAPEAPSHDISDRDGDGRVGEESAIKERIKAYIELHGQDGELTSRHMLDKARFSYSQWLADGRHLGAKGLEGDGFVNIGPVNGAGRVAAIAPHPTLEGVVLQGAASGGVWKTLDGGLTWYPTTDGLSDLSVGAVAWAPGSNDVVYLGTGEGDTLIAGGTGYIPGIGLLRSDDGGETWIFPTGDENPVSDLFFALDIDPDNDEIVFAATENGLLGTEDGGVTWQTLIPTTFAFTEVVRSKSNADLLYACQWCNSSCPAGTGRVMRSEDRGVTWLPVGGEGLPGLVGYAASRAAFAVAPSDDQVLYFATNTDSGINGATPTSSIFRSADGGETWTETALSTTNLANNYLGNQGWYDTTIVVSPTNPDIVNAGGVWYVQTKDGGQTWVSKYSYSQGGGMGSATIPHVDVHDLQYQGDTLWVGNDGGVWKSENDGDSWSGRNDGVVTRQYYGMDIDPVNRERVLGGTQDNGTNLRRDAGDDKFDLVLGGDGFECAINPMMPEIMYGTLYWTRVFRTNPTSGSFREITPPFRASDEDPPFITPLILHPSNPNTVFTGAERLWRSDNGGDSWYGLPKDTVNDISGFLWTTGKVWALAATPADPDRIMMSKGGVVYSSRDGGLTWFSSVVGKKAYHLDISPHDPDLALAAMEVSYAGRGVQRTTDGGTTWNYSGTGLPLFNTQTVRFDPTDPDVAYAGTDVGLYRSTDGGVTWARWGDGLPAASIHDIRILPDGSMMRIGTYGRGFWELAMERPENARPEIQINDPSISTVSVNPGDTLALKATATDADGDLLHIDWYMTTDYRIFHQDQGTGNVTSDFSMVVPSGGLYEIAARVTDAHGEQDVEFFNVMAIDPADSCDSPRVVPGDGPFPTRIVTSNVFAAMAATDPVLSCVDPATSDPDSGREASLWFEFTPVVSGTYAISTCGSEADTMVSVWTGDACGTSTEVTGGCNDDGENQHCLGAPSDSYLELDLVAETTYRIMVGSWKSLQGRTYKGLVTFTIDCITCGEMPLNMTMISAAANADGLNDTFWLTDLDLYNPGADDVTATLAFLPRDADNTDIEGVDAVIPAGQTRTFSDVVGMFLGSEGSGAIRITSDERVIAASRTFNTSEDGTFGQFIPGMTMNQAIDPGGEARLNGLAGNAFFRTNLGFANASDSAANLSVDLIAADGSVIGHIDPALQPWGWLQMNKVFETAGTGNVEAASAIVRNVSADAQVFAYASVVDAETGDPTFVSETSTGTSGSDLWVAASAHADGIGQSIWRTDVWLSNTTESEVTARIDLLEKGQDNTAPPSSDVAIPAGENLLLGDILDTTFQFNGTAALRIALDGDATVTSRTFNQAVEGTFGQFIPGMSQAASVAQGETGILIQLRNNDQFRTNIGFVNTGNEIVAIHAEYFSSDGTLLNAKDYFLQPFGYFQDGGALPGDSDVEGAFALLTTTTAGGRFLAYASVVDNGSDDPIFMPAQVLAD